MLSLIDMSVLQSCLYQDTSFNQGLSYVVCMFC